MVMSPEALAKYNAPKCNCGMTLPNRLLLSGLATVNGTIKHLFCGVLVGRANRFCGLTVTEHFQLTPNS